MRIQLAPLELYPNHLQVFEEHQSTLSFFFFETVVAVLDLTL